MIEDEAPKVASYLVRRKHTAQSTGPADPRFRLATQPSDLRTQAP